VSWEGHVSGFVTGLVFAFIFKDIGPQKFQYDWEKDDYEPDEFDTLFDEREENQTQEPLPPKTEN